MNGLSPNVCRFFVSGCVIFGVAVLFIVFRTKGEDALSPLPRVWVRDIPLQVEVADSDRERAQGLQNITVLPIDHGMLFFFPKKTTPDFWMKNTLIPLDIVWIADGTIVDVTANVQPEPFVTDENLQRYRPRVPVDHVLELNGGAVQSFRFVIGDPIRFDF